MSKKKLLDICVTKEAINVLESAHASVSAFQESRDQSGKPDGGEKWQDKIFATRAQKRMKKIWNEPTCRTACCREPRAAEFAHDHRHP